MARPTYAAQLPGNPHKGRQGLLIHAVPEEAINAICGASSNRRPWMPTPHATVDCPRCLAELEVRAHRATRKPRAPKKKAAPKAPTKAEPIAQPRPAPMIRRTIPGSIFSLRVPFYGSEKDAARFITYGCPKDTTTSVELRT